MRLLVSPSIGSVRLRSGIILWVVWIALGLAGIQTNNGTGEIRNLPSAVLFSLGGLYVAAIGISLIRSERFRVFLLKERSEEEELLTASALICLVGTLLFLGGLAYVYKFAA